MTSTVVGSSALPIKHGRTNLMVCLHVPRKGTPTRVGYQYDMCLTCGFMCPI